MKKILITIFFIVVFWCAVAVVVRRAKLSRMRLEMAEASTLVDELVVCMRYMGEQDSQANHAKLLLPDQESGIRVGAWTVLSENINSKMLKINLLASPFWSSTLEDRDRDGVLDRVVRTNWYGLVSLDGGEEEQRQFSNAVKDLIEHCWDL